MDDRAGEGSGDPVDRLDRGNDELAEVVDALRAGPDDHVVGTRDIFCGIHTFDLTDGFGDSRSFPDFGLDKDVSLNFRQGDQPSVGSCWIGVQVNLPAGASQERPAARR